jgi:hypothetical protein
MVSAIVKIVLGLFIWFFVPGIIQKSIKRRNKSFYFVVDLLCKVLGVAIILSAMYNLFIVLFS